MRKLTYAGVVLAVALLPVTASPALAAAPPAASMAVSAVSAVSPPIRPPHVKPVQNNAGVREMLKAAASARAGLKAAESAVGLVDRLEAGLADGSLSPRAAEKLQKRVDAAMARARSLFFQAEEWAARAYNLHEGFSDRAVDSGREPQDSPAWVAAVSAYETAIDALFDALSDGSGDVIPTPR